MQFFNHKWGSLIVIGLCFLTSFGAWSKTLGQTQLQPLDSINSSQEVEKAHDLLEISRHKLLTFPDSSLLLAKQSLSIFEKSSDIEGMIMSQSQIASGYYFLGEMDKALSIYSSLLWDIDEDKYPEHKAQMLMYIGRSFRDFGMQSIALEYLLEANNRWKDLGDKERMASNLIIIASSQYRMDDKYQAIKTHKEAIGLLNELDITVNQSIALSRLAEISFLLANWTLQQYYWRRHCHWQLLSITSIRYPIITLYGQELPWLRNNIT